MTLHESHHTNLFDEANQAWDAGKKKRAFQLFLAAAINGEEDAFNSVGYFLDHGIGTEKNPSHAYTWYRRAAMRGNLAGCLNLGAWYRDSGNLSRAKFWFEKAFAQGDGSAAYELGKLYLSQRSTKASVERATRYLTAAVQSKYLFEDERERAKDLLNEIKT